MAATPRLSKPPPRAKGEGVSRASRAVGTAAADAHPSSHVAKVRRIQVDPGLDLLFHKDLPIARCRNRNGSHAARRHET